MPRVCPHRVTLARGAQCIHTAHPCNKVPDKSSLDRRFSFSAIALRITGPLRTRGDKVDHHARRAVNARNLRQAR